jgi:hypothetical protein
MNRNSPPLPANSHKWKVEDGNDGKQYVSRPDKNNVFRWQKLNSSPKRAFDYYKQLFPAKDIKKKFNDTTFVNKMNAVTKELKKHKIFVFHLEWGRIRNDIDFAWDVVLENVARTTRMDALKVMDHYSILFFTDNQLFWATTGSGIMYLQHSILKKDRSLIQQAFKKHFKKATIPMSPQKAIEIKMDKK